MTATPMAAGLHRASSSKGIRQISRASIEARILAAAESVFAETGFSGATTAEIAKRAGVPTANLHYYFKTKADLYRQVLQAILDLWLGTGDLIKPESDPAEALGHYIAAKIERARERPRFRVKAHQAGRVATPGGAKRRPVTRSDTPERSR